MGGYDEDEGAEAEDEADACGQVGTAGGPSIVCSWRFAVEVGGSHHGRVFGAGMAVFFIFAGWVE